MNHSEAEQRQAADRYLAGELSHAERTEFEEHFFECPECAREVETGVLFAANARAVFQEEQARQCARQAKTAPRRWWPHWGRPALVFAPAALALLVICFEEMIRIPALQRNQLRADAPISYPAFFLAPAARGAGQILSVPRTARFAGLQLDVPPGGPYRNFECEIRRGGEVFVVTSPSPAAGNPINILLPASRLNEGRYTLLLRGRNEGTAGTELGAFEFTIQLN